MKLSILVCTLEKRYALFSNLTSTLLDQIEGRVGEVNIIIESDKGELSIGAKRNLLLKRAESKYVVFVDDDDRISGNYIDLLMEGIEKDVDCCSLIGEYTVNGKNPKKFLHYLACEKYHETPEAYHRYPNHLNCIRASIAKRFKFPEKNWGEDTDWATQIKKSGLLKTEHTISQTIYYYDKTTK